MQRSKNRLFAFLPSLFSILGGVMFLAIVLVLVCAQPWFEAYYQNRSLLSNMVLWLAALAGVGLLELLCIRCGGESAEKRSLWLTRGAFAAVLLLQFVVARSCWYKMGWDISVVYTTAEELARGVALSNPTYFDLCPNNAPLTILQFIPMWVAVKIGLAVPFVVLPYIDAVLLNAAAYIGVRCVHSLTPSRVARGFALTVSICWIALSPYILYPYSLRSNGCLCRASASLAPLSSPRCSSC